MKEDFLQIIWQMQNFYLPAESTEGCSIRVLKPGIRNRENGPDFLHSRIFMDQMEWNGAVEVHVRAGEWYAHGHQSDPAYDGVILHVVWEEDRPVFRRDGSRIPALELKSRISLNQLLHYRNLLSASNQIPCTGLNRKIPEILKNSMLETALAERLWRKANELLEKHKSGGFDWQRTAAIWLARCLGMPGNEDPMESLIHKLSQRRLRRVLSQPLDEMDFFSPPGTLRSILDSGESRETSPKIPVQNTDFQEIPIPWKTGGRRPAALPFVRIKLLARLINHFSEWPDIGPEPDFVDFILQRGEKVPGWLRNHLRINFQAIYQLARFIQAGVPDAGNRAMEYLRKLDAEENQVTRRMTASGFFIASAADSQGGKELLDSRCSRKKCMDCRIGLALISGPISRE